MKPQVDIWDEKEEEEPEEEIKEVRKKRRSCFMSYLKGLVYLY